MKKIENTIKQLQKEIKGLEKTLKAKEDILDDNAREKAEELVDRTIDTIDATIEKVKAVVDEKVDDDKIEEFLENVEVKSKEAVDYAKAKIEEFACENKKFDLDKLFDEISSDFEKIKESDTFKKVTDFAKDAYNQVNDYLQKPEVKQAIDKAKKTTIDIAEKGVEGLKKVLTSKEEEKEDKE